MIHTTFLKTRAGPIWIIFVLIFAPSTTFLKVGCFKIHGYLSSKCHHYSSINHYNIYLYGLQKTI